MQVFLLDLDLEKNVTYYMDKHVVKTPAAIQQILLNTCARLRIKFPQIKQANGIPMMPLPSIMSNPFCKWASSAPANFDYLLEIGLLLCQEYKLRFNEHHYNVGNLLVFDKQSSSVDRPAQLERYPWMLPMAYQDKQAGLVESYRKYYIETKHHLATWSNPRSRPEWFPQTAVDEGKKISAAFHAAKKGSPLDGLNLAKEIQDVDY